MPDSPTLEPESTVVHNCDKGSRSACDGEAFYKEHEGKRYCVLHFPSKEKSIDFQIALQKKVANRDFNFCAIWFPDRVDFCEFKFDKDVNFSSATFSTSANFRDSTFGANVTFAGATFNGAADFTSGTFLTNAHFNSATFNGAAHFDRATFRGPAVFSRATFSGEAYFRSSTFSAKAYFRSSTFATTSFSGSTFSATVQFSANFGGVADFGGVIFSGIAYFSSANFSATASFRKANLCAAAHFGNAKFSAVANFRKTTFSDEANLASVTFGAAADFRKATFRAKTSFNSSTFGAAAYFRSATLCAAADFRSAIFSGDVEFTNTTLSGKTDFGDATFKEYVRFAGKENKPMFSDTSSLNLQFTRIGKPDNLSFHTLTLRPYWFVNIDARKFEFINVSWSLRSFQESKDLSSGGFESKTQLLAIACRQLAVNAEDNHRYEEASRFRYMAMDVRRRERWRGLGVWRLSWWYWLASGYGERAFQALLVLLGIWLLFALLYTQIRFAQFPAALTYSAAVMTFQRPEPKPATTSAHAVVLLETILGPVQAALLALAIRRKFMR